eukprot:4778-Heterococcus_DN1.PRE.2
MPELKYASRGNCSTLQVLVVSQVVVTMQVTDLGALFLIAGSSQLQLQLSTNAVLLSQHRCHLWRAQVTHVQCNALSTDRMLAMHTVRLAVLAASSRAS